MVSHRKQLVNLVEDIQEDFAELERLNPVPANHHGHCGCREGIENARRDAARKAADRLRNRLDYLRGEIG